MVLSAADITAIGLSVRLATVVTLILLIIGTPLAWWLVRSRSPLKVLVNTLVAMPLVLPPTVIGFYLLLVLGANGVGGAISQSLGLGLLPFTFWGLVIASVIYSLPFVVQPLQTAMVAIGNRPLEVAATLGASPVDRFFSVVVPMAKPGFITAAIMGFAHTIGEFGVVLMIGGNIPGSTQVVSVQLYDHVESLQYAQAHWLAASLLAFSFVVLFLLHWFNRHNHKAGMHYGKA